MPENVNASAEGVCLQLEGVSLAFAGHSVFDNLSLELRRGEVVVVSGTNGSGKTSLLRLIVGVQSATSGIRTPVGVDPARGIAFVPASIEPVRLSPARWLDLFPRTRARSAQTTLQSLGFDGRVHRPMRELSFGNLRKLVIAEALSSPADLIVIDEASAGLDRQGLRGLRDAAQRAAEAGCTIVLADQEGGFDWTANRFMWIDAGRLVEKTSQRSVVRVAGPSERIHELRQIVQEVGFDVV